MSPGGYAGGDIEARSGSGIDVDEYDDSDGTVLRISAIRAKRVVDARRYVDMRIDGDQCITVDAIPFSVWETEDGTEWDPTKADGATPDGTPGYSKNAVKTGVVVLRSKCKACCQCEDYAAAANKLASVNDEIGRSITGVFGVAGEYAKAVKAYNASVDAVTESINDYQNVTTRAVKTVGPSGSGTGYYTVATTVLNMTMLDLAVSVSVEGTGSMQSQSYTTSSGASANAAPSPSVTLPPGGTLSYSFMRTRSGSNTNPSCKVSFNLTLQGKDSTTITKSL